MAIENECLTVIEAAELAYGLLWMMENKGRKQQAAYIALRNALSDQSRARGINAAIQAGYEADHPPGCEYWAGM